MHDWLISLYAINISHSQQSGLGLKFEYSINQFGLEIEIKVVQSCGRMNKSKIIRPIIFSTN